ncbi:acyl carrier protein [Pseudomonas gingeri]|uniref:Acyl carrier protein n=1 Tax=Pseudomonas gingeri TaxID=117681 RepID=A0A7Y8C5Z6_9PSED|nr:acyl carrier protein [Pseudomonas gingeri]NWA27630.1 acyl carrier protein [Pseudomonas gingeri]NWC00370.1 acyl carrier protein [Pseudomonas gingeri]NWD69699.1 acyl carrier protein [Pseudomonas gingeri]NWD75493.1 acyl carrier protein [Pseudomonas gingeri]
MNYLVPGGCDYFIEQQVMVLLAEHFSVPRRKIRFESRLLDDLGIGSADLVELVGRINGAFRVALSVDEAECWRTVADLCRLVGNARGEGGERRKLLL